MTTTTHAMSHADAAWLHMDRPTNLMIVTSAMWTDEPLDAGRLREVMQERLVDAYPRFTQRVVEGLTGAHWEDDPTFDLDLHVHHLALPHPGDCAALEAVVGDLMSQPLDRSRPLWAMYLLDGYGDGSAIVMRMHHAIADGIALARVMLGLTDERAEAAQAIFSDAPHVRARLPLEGTVRDLARITGEALHEGAETLLHPWHLAAIAGEVVADAEALLKLLGAPTEHRSPLHDEIGATWRAAWSRPLALADVKQAGRRHGATINDVLVSCVAGAVRTYLTSAGVDPVDVHAMVPFNLRPLDQPLPRDLGNRFGLVLLDLPVGIEDPVRRLRESHTRMSAIKTSREGPMAYAVLGAIGHTPPALEARIVDMFSAKATMVLTNVPGPRKPVYLAGARIGGVLGWAPCSGAVGMSVSIFSYDGEVTVGFMVNGRLVEEPHDLVAAFESAAGALVSVTA